MCHNARSPVINIIYVRCAAETCIWLYDVVRWADGGDRDRNVSARSTNLPMENDKDGVSEQNTRIHKRHSDFVNTCYI